MAKGSTAVIQKAKRDIRRTNSALTRGRMKDFRTTQGINDSIFGNLSTFMDGRKRSLTSFNSRVLQQMATLVARAKTSGRQGALAPRGVTDAYGGIGASAVQQAFAPAALKARDNTELAQAGQGEVKRVAQTGASVLDIAKQGATEAQAGAEYATAQALTARTKQDVAAVAQMREQLTMAELQHQYQMEEAQQQAQLARKNLLLQQRLATKKAGVLVGGQLNSISQGLAEASAAVRGLLEADPSLSKDDILQRLQDSGDITAADAANPAIARLINIIKANHIYGGRYKTYDEEVSAILSSVQFAYPDHFAKYRPTLSKLVLSTLKSLYNGAAASGGGGGGGGSSVPEVVPAVGSVAGVAGGARAVVSATRATRATEGITGVLKAATGLGEAASGPAGAIMADQKTQYDEVVSYAADALSKGMSDAQVLSILQKKYGLSKEDAQTAWIAAWTQLNGKGVPS